MVGVSIILFVFNSLVWSQDLREILGDFNLATRSLRQGSQIPGSCFEQREITTPTNSCNNFYKEACKSTTDTTADSSLNSPAIFNAFESGINSTITSSPKYTRFQETIAQNNNGETPVFSTSLEETNSNFQRALCQGKENNAANRNALIAALGSRFDNINNPIFSTTNFLTRQEDHFQDIKNECIMRCMRTSDNRGVSPTNEACTTHCERHENLLDYLAIMMDDSPARDVIQDGNHAANTTIVNLFSYMGRSGFNLHSMCLKMTQILTDVYDSTYSEILDSRWKTLDVDGKKALARNVQAAAFPADFRSSSEAMLQRVKSESVSLLTRYAGGTIPQALSDRLNNVAINWSVGESLDDIQSRALGANAGYFNSKNQIQVWAGMRDQPPYSMLYTLAHEMGHAMDRSQEKRDIVGDTVFNPSMDNLNACFGKSTHQHPTTRLPQHGAGADYNQRGECLGDYYGTEIFFNLINGMTPPLSDSEKRKAVAQTVMNCNSEGGYDELPNDPHPSWRTRSERIIMAHPGMRQLFGCTTDQRNDPFYCPSGAIR